MAKFTHQKERTAHDFLPAQSFPKYGLFSGQIKYAPNEKVYVAIWGKNLNNKKYVTYAGAQNGPSGYPFIGGAPRTYGVTAGFEF